MHGLLEKNRAATTIYEIVGVYDLQPIGAGDTAESFKFRIEVLQDKSRK
jgi:hypothetical protein